MPRSRPPRRVRPLAGLEVLEAREQPSATLLGDIATAPASAFASFYGAYLGGPASGAVLGTSVVFAATDGAHDGEVWKSDGTAAGTKLVAVLPDNGQNGSPIAQPVGFTAAGGKVYFTYDDGTHGSELWVTDGTAAGTKLVADAAPGRASSYPMAVAAVGNKLVYSASSQEASFHTRLYATDGTAAGTVTLADLGANIVPGFTAAGGKVYYIAHTADPTTHAITSQVWETDGTVAGTRAAATLPGNAEPDAFGGPGWLTAVGSKLYFAARDSDAGRELWVSTAAAAEPTRIADLNTTEPQANPSYPTSYTANYGSNPEQLTTLGTTAYFVADDGVHGQELWRTGGLAVNTRMVADLSPTVGSNPPGLYQVPDPSGSKITGLTAVGSKLYFSADDGVHGAQLYASDGTATGTVRLTDVAHAPVVPGSWTPSETPALLSAVGGTVFFSIGDVTTGRQLWATDGTAAGTHPLTLIGIGSSDPSAAFTRGQTPLGVVGGRLLFHAADDAHGRQLWATDGTAAGTAVVSTINPANLGSFPGGFTAANGRAYFTASTDDGRTAGLYATDGTAAPVLVKGFAATDPGTAAGAFAERPTQVTAAGGMTYFLTRVGAFGGRLFKTDGTAAGTVVVKELAVPTDLALLFSFTPRGMDNLTAVGSTLYFTLDTQAGGKQLWKTDGSAAGTKLVRQLTPGVTPPTPGAPLPTPEVTSPAVRQLTAVGGKLYFVAADGDRGSEVWVSDGTAAGTKVAADVNPGPAGSFPDDLAVLNGRLYFTAQDGTHGRQLWTTDGTAAGTKLVAAVNNSTALDIIPPSRSAYGPEVREMVAAGGKLFLVGTDAAAGYQLWVSDGTAAGTRRVTQLPAALTLPNQPGDPVIGGLTAAGGKVFFSASDPTLGRQLWVSDGTTTGTKMVGPLGDGSQAAGYRPLGLKAGADPVILAATATGVVFMADDGVHGRELWATDGTAAGTTLVRDFRPGSPGGLGTRYNPIPGDAAVVSGKLVLAADDGSHGSEPWAVSMTDVLPPPPVVSPPVTPPPPVVTPPAAAVLVAAAQATAVPGAAADLTLGTVRVSTGVSYVVSVVWGDGTSGTGSLVAAAGTGALTVTARHAYAAAGTYTATVRLIVRGGDQVLKFTTTVTVAATPTPNPVADSRFYVGRVADRLTAGQAFDGVAGTIRSLNPQSAAAEFTATIDWGDGGVSAGKVRQVDPGRFEVTGRHTFAAAGKRTVTVYVTGPGGRSGEAESVFTIDLPGPAPKPLAA